MLIALNKPHGVLCQFTDPDGRPTLAAHVRQAGVYAAGRLDLDSEGLLLLTDDGALATRITEPRHALSKTYLAQVEGAVEEAALMQLRNGVTLKDGLTRPAEAESVLGQPPGLWPRDPPVRYRAHIPTRWLLIRIREGRNRQIRRMTAAVGLPTLRLIRIAIGGITLAGLQPGDTRTVDADHLWQEPPPLVEWAG